MNHQSLIIFTDLDGTLLDHESYRYDAATEALELLREQQIPLILASSKTAAEIAPLRTALGFSHCPAIVENGAGLLPAESSSPTGQSDYERLIDALDKVPTELRKLYRGFSQMSAQEVSNVTGLGVKAAELAKDRHFSEPGIWSGSDNDLAAFLASLKLNGVYAKRGGRFLTLSFGGDKAEQMKHLIAQYKTTENTPVSLALGDAPNDIEMLNTADFGVIVKNDTHGGVPTQNGEKTGNITRTQLAGPAGWNKAVLTFVKKQINKENSNG